MKIFDVRVKRFKSTAKTERDSEGHGHPGPERESVQSLTEIITEEGVSGYCFGGSQSVMDGVVKPAIVGEDPMYREKIWQRLNEWQRLHKGVLSDRVIAGVDMALWDLAGKAAGVPIYQMLGGKMFDRIKMYRATGGQLPWAIEPGEP